MSFLKTILNNPLPVSVCALKYMYIDNKNVQQSMKKTLVDGFYLAACFKQAIFFNMHGVIVVLCDFIKEVSYWQLWRLWKLFSQHLRNVKLSWP